MQIMLAKDVEAFVEEQVRIGATSSAGDLVNDALRALSVQRQRPFAVSAELEAWLLKAADGPVAPLGKADFEGIRERVQSRLVRTAS
jgi:Arc/MetJ-type ribon-helix-helix transcriptional regulator